MRSEDETYIHEIRQLRWQLENKLVALLSTVKKIESINWDNLNIVDPPKWMPKFLDKVDIEEEINCMRNALDSMSEAFDKAQDSLKGVDNEV